MTDIDGYFNFLHNLFKETKLILNICKFIRSIRTKSHMRESYRQKIINKIANNISL